MRILEIMLYAAILILASAAIVLVLNAPPDFVKSTVVYGKF